MFLLGFSMVFLWCSDVLSSFFLVYVLILFLFVMLHDVLN